MGRRIIQRLGAIVGLAVVYFLAGKLGLKLALVHPSATAVWPPTGIALAALLLFGYKLWPGVFLGAFAVNLTTAGTVVTSLGIATGNTLEGLLGAYLICRFAHGRQALFRAEDVLKFAFLGGIVSTTVAASFGVASLSLGGYIPREGALSVWLTWWLGDMVGAIVVAPCLILWCMRRPAKRSPREISQAAIAAFSLLFVAVILFGGFLPAPLDNYSLTFLCIPLVVWCAFYLQPQEAATAVIALAGIAMWGTLREIGVFSGERENAILLLLQTFMGVIAMTSLVLSSVIGQRNTDQDALKAVRDELEARVAERTLQLEHRIAGQKRTEAALRDLSAHLLRVQDEERRRIARDLHDSTGQSLAVLSMNLDRMQSMIRENNPDLAKKISESETLVKQMVKEVRTTSYLLHPPLLDEHGLASALGWYVAGFQERSSIKVDLRMPEAWERLPSDLETAIFRVIQECLTNVHRHSGSKRATICVTQVSSGVVVEVKDDGVGIPPEKLAQISSSGLPGVGLRGMRERVRGFQGEFEVFSAGNGTHIKVFFPTLSAKI